MADINEGKAGYKKTKVGWIPEEWSNGSISSIGKVITGTTPSTKNPDYYGDEIPFVGPADLDKGEIYSAIKNLSKLGAKKARVLPINSTLVTCIGSSIGKVGISRVPLATNQQLNAVVWDCDPGYGYYSTLRLGPKLKFFAGTQAVPILNKTAFSKLHIPLPPLPEQRRIAAILSTWDEAIERLEALIERKQALKRGLMQQLLTGRTRFPEFVPPGGTRYKDTKLGPVPEDWEVVALSNLVKKSIRYGIVQPGEYDPNGRFMVRGQDYSKGWVSEDKIFRVSAAIEKRYKNARLASGDIIITIVGNTGIVKMVPKWLDGANMTQTTARISPSNRIEGKYLAYYLDSDFGKRLNYRYQKGGVQPGLNCGDIAKYPIVSPSLSEQRRITEILSLWDQDINNLEALIQKKKEQKKGLMQQLLTGAVRVQT